MIGKRKNKGGGERKSTATLVLSGAISHNPEKYASRLLEPGGGLRPIGDPPRGLTKAELLCWHEILATCHAGTVFEEDRFVVEEFAKVLAAMKNRKSKKIDAATYARFFKLVAMFGLSPADRSRVSVQPGTGYDENNPFSGLTQ
jgi:hypothetical protein